MKANTCIKHYQWRRTHFYVDIPSFSSFPSNSTIFFQLLLLQHSKRDLLYEGFDKNDTSRFTIKHIEDQWIRCLTITTVSLKVHLTYNRAEVKVTESRSTLTEKGHPVSLPGTHPQKSSCKYWMSDPRFITTSSLKGSPNYYTVILFRDVGFWPFTTLWKITKIYEMN